jgi:predicted GIY-YIG superfamily endonuclease
MVTVYILECEGGHFYVGKTWDVAKRTKQHFEGYGAEWTKFHKPIKVLQVIENCMEEDEDKFTKVMMKKYGIDKVRGGTYCQVRLPDATKAFLRNEIYGATNACYRCGQQGHFAKVCTSTNEVDMTALVRELKGVRDAAMHWMTKNRGTIKVCGVKVDAEKLVTRFDTNAASVTYVREHCNNTLQIGGVAYEVLETKRDFGLIGAYNYIIVKGVVPGVCKGELQV